jgi:SsrA-binding protein
MKELNIVNKKANFDYFIEETFEAGIMLQGWEFKSILKNKASLLNSYVNIREGELYLFNSLIQPLETTSTHVVAEPTRSRKLLMHRKEINKLIGLVEQKGYTLIPLKMVLRNKVKLIFGLAKGKKNFDKRQTEKEKDWKREQEMLFKKSSK